MIEGRKIYRLFSVLLVASYTWIAYNLYSFTHHTNEISLCLFKNITGLPCPACGITRAMIELLHLNIVNAIRVNPLAIPVLFVLLILPFWIMKDFISRKPGFLHFYFKLEKTIASNRVLQLMLITGLLINWSWSIYKGL